MAHHNAHNINHVRLDLADPFYTCGRCGKNISSYGPPAYNAQNCSCSDLASFSIGHGTHTYQSQVPPQALVFEEPSHYATTHAGPLPYHQPESYTTDRSVPGQEGVENQAPDLQTGAGYLLLNGSPNDQERQIQEVEAQPWSIQRYLGRGSASSFYDNTDHHLDSSISSSKVNTNFLKLNSRIGAPTTMRKSSSKRKSSAQSSRRAEVETAIDGWTWDVNPVTGAGGWLDIEGDLYEFIEGRSPYATELVGCFKPGCQG